MKSYRIILLTILAAAGLNSCVKEKNIGKTNETGQLVVTVNAESPAVKAISQVTDYPVVIKKGSETIKSFDKVSDITSAIILDIGSYSVESHTPGTIARKMYNPYYSGSSDFSIISGTTTNAEVVCTMQNTRISVIYGPDFYNVFSKWTITIDDGTDTVLQFNEADGRSDDKTVFYWHFINEVNEVNINFVGYTKENGSKISQKYTVSKSASTTGYDDDKQYFSGGDALEFTFTPEEATTGKVSSVILKAEIKFEETEESVIFNVEDVPTFDPGDDDPDDDPDHPTLIPITLTIPAPITLPENDLSKGDVKIEAENGLQSLTVKVNSSSEEMVGSLTAVAEEYPGVDLITGCEVVNNQALVAFLGSLGQNITVPAIGDKEYTFPVGNFFGFLGLLPGEHNFVMTAVDMDGNTKSGTVKVTVPEE